MWHFKHYCKLIISTIVVVLVFACHSLVSYADPFTGAMISSGFVSGVGISGMSGMSAQAATDIINRNVSYNDPYEWGVLNKNVKIKNIPNDEVEITLNPEIAETGYSRTNQYLTYNNILPHQSFDNGTYFTYIPGNYTFYTPATPTRKIGPVVGVFPYHDDLTFSHVYYVTPDDYLSFAVNNNVQKYRSKFFINSSETSPRTYPNSFQNRPFSFSLSVDAGHYYLGWTCYDANNSYMTFESVEITSRASQVLRSNHIQTSYDGDSVTDPEGQFNRVTIPNSYVAELSYTSDQYVDSSSFAETVLNIILDAAINGDIIASVYVDDVIPEPTPTPEPVVPDGTLKTTLWDDFTDFFNEKFGDIYDGITDFQESFGDWVDDVASGWTEIFGDIYSTLTGTISTTLSTISSAVQSLVQTIENADFDFVDAFWKNFLTPFNSLFNTIKSHLSIWHYVVEWLASISSVFTFYLGVFSGAGSGYLLPIYACFAGTVVIAVYKRFGK